ncbi:hypothetical protein ILUMI_20168 [Ignelater luminosus]|uniref:Uncharacterized protein n=1 Tax=Ignelater luminosus TaxID=2038154 RepID=A0A8K0G4V5_IGNLU|nr:hypothetical protein ILUMI_20168 [Ignelater luminosus]
MQATEEKALRDICIFLVLVYLKGWFEAPIAVQAPFNNFNFFKRLMEYPVSEIATKAFSAHLWYLAPETVALAFFDFRIPKAIKVKMAENLMRSGEREENVSNRILIFPQQVPDFVKQEFSESFSPTAMNFFRKFNISTNFLTEYIDCWETHKEYKFGRQAVQNLLVVNDPAERGVKLMQEYNSILTKDENKKQFILQIVNQYRKLYPNSRKETLW